MGKKEVKVSVCATTETPAPLIPLLPSDKILDGISSLLKKLRKASELKVPAFKSEHATIYLQFATNNVQFDHSTGRVPLPHALSHIRSVCLIARTDSEKQKNPEELVAMVKEAGVVGKVHVLTVENLRETLTSRDVEGLNKLAESYDTFLADCKAMKNITVDVLYEVMNKHNKHINIITDRGSVPLKDRIKQALNATSMTPSTAKDAYNWRVGHRAMSESELLANVNAVLDKMAAWKRTFTAGLAHFSAVRLVNGVDDAVDLYVNPGEVVAHTAPKRKERDHFVNADDHLYWLNRMQQEDGTAYWKLGDRKIQELIEKNIPSGTEKSSAARIERLKAIRAERAAKTPKAVKKREKFAAWKEAKRAKAIAAAKAVMGDAKVGAADTKATIEAKKVLADAMKAVEEARKALRAANKGAPVVKAAADPKTVSKVAKKKAEKAKATGPAATGDAPPSGQAAKGLTKNAKRHKKAKDAKAAAKLALAAPESQVQDAPGSGKKRKADAGEPTAPGSAKVAKLATPAAAGTPGSGKKNKKNRKSNVASATPLKAMTPGQKSPLNETTPQKDNAPTLLAGTPGSGKKKRRSQSAGTLAAAKENTPIQKEAPQKENTPVAVKPNTPQFLAVGVSPAGTPGSGKKRKRSRSNGTPMAAVTPAQKQNNPGQENTPRKQNTPKPNTPGQQNTPGKQNTPKPNTPGQQNTPGKQNTPKPNTPGQQNTPSLKNTPGNQNTPGSQNATAKPNTPVQKTPLAVALPATTPAAVATPGSGGKRRRTRKSFMPGTPGISTPGAVGTPGSDSKKSPAMKMRLRQRPSMSFKN